MNSIQLAITFIIQLLVILPERLCAGAGSNSRSSSFDRSVIAMSAIHFHLNGQQTTIADADPNRSVLAWLREEAGLTGTKEGCNEGDCGACTVIHAERKGESTVLRAMNSCIMLLPQLQGRSIHTIEGIDGSPDDMHPVQAAMVEHHASQCGFCTPGIVMSLVAASGNSVTDYDRVLAGNLCRCTGYEPIVSAARAAPTGVTPLAVPAFCPGPRSSPDCFIPESLDEFAEWYLEHPDATIVAGATDVGLWVTKQLRDISPACFIGNLGELATMRMEGDHLHVGAAVTLEDFHARIAGPYPSLAEMVDRFGSVQVRNNATVGGNIANGSPIGDLAPALIALGSRLVLRRGNTRREIQLEDFFIDYGILNLESGEFVEKTLLPTNQPSLRCYKLSKRFDQDISAVCGCFNIRTEKDRITSARIAFGGMAATPRRATSVENYLVGRQWNDATVADAYNGFESDFSPITDMRAGRKYRSRAAANLLSRYFTDMTRPDVQTSVYRFRTPVR